MERSARRFVKFSGGDLISLVRGRQKLSDALLEANRKPYQVLPHSSSITKASTTALEVEIDKVSLPKQAGQVDPGAILERGPEQTRVLRDLRQERPLRPLALPQLARLSKD